MKQADTSLLNIGEFSDRENVILRMAYSLGAKNAAANLRKSMELLNKEINDAMGHEWASRRLLEFFIEQTSKLEKAHDDAFKGSVSD